MASSARDGVAFGSAVLAGFKAKNVPFMAASIAYQAFISLLPLLVLLFFLVTILGDEAAADQAVAATEGVLPESGQLLVAESIEESPATAGSTLIGLVVLLWGSLKIFRGLDTAFSEIYETTEAGSFVHSLRNALVVFGGVGGALLAAVIAGIGFALVPPFPLEGVVQSTLLVVVLGLAFFPVYYYLPDVDVQPRQVLPGVVVAAVGWMALQSLFRLYVRFTAESGGSDPFGAIILLLTWLYFGGLLLLGGGVVNAVSTGHLRPTEETAAGHRALERERASRDRDLARLESRLERLERERNQLAADLAAQRTRRYRLEDELDDLRGRNEELVAQTERLQARLERRDQPPWRRLSDRLIEPVDRIRVGTIKRE